MLQQNVLLTRIRELRREMDRIYAMGNDMTSPELLQVSRELDLLMVKYLQSDEAYSGESKESGTGS